MKKILISGIKDSAPYIDILEKEGHIVTKVIITQVTPLLAKYQPDLIILGTCVDSDNGADIIKEVKEQNKEIKIIGIGKSDALKKEFLLEGANDFLIKPVSKEQLLDAVNEKKGQM